MAEEQGTTGGATAAGGIAGLFSVDADAHLQKLAACMFPTPAQLPVELVRSALKRGASTVAVQIRRSRLVVEDDGEAIADGQWDGLVRALDERRPAGERERAIATLQESSRPGIGLLAVLVPGALDILIASPGRGLRPPLRFAAGALRPASLAQPRVGTRIVIRRRGGAATAEKRLLAELCAGASPEITLNGRKIEKKPVLRRALVRQALEKGTAAGNAMVAIPAQGDICRIWLLDQQIPWQLFTCASCQGLVFDAALESRSPATEGEFGRLAAAAGRLYAWLAGQYPSFPGHWQERIEELIFRRIKAGGDPHLAASFAPFRLRRSRLRLSLAEVRRRAEAGRLAALPDGGDGGRFLAPHQEALLLTPRQMDFLINDAGVPLSVPPLATDGAGPFARLAASCRRSCQRLAARLPRPRLRETGAADLSAGESRLCREMELLLREHHDATSPFIVRVAMTPGRGFSPALWRPGASDSVLWLRQGHPLVQAAARSVADDRANAELTYAALAPRAFLTGGRR